MPSTEEASELETLQKSYDDFIESSKEFEGELEHAIKDAEGKLAEMTTKKAQSDAKLTATLEKSAQLSKELQHVQNELTKARQKLALLDESTKKLENANDSLLDKVRILEATEEDLTHKLENAEEDIVFLQSDLTEVKEQRSEVELRLRAELRELQAELSILSVGKSNGDYKSHATTPNVSPNPKQGAKNSDGAASADSTEQALLLQELELEVDDLTNRLSESEQQNSDLSEEVSRLSEEVIQCSHYGAVAKAHKTREVKLETLVRGLNTQLLEAKGFLVELEESNTQLEETNTELFLANSDLDALNVDLEGENSTVKNENTDLKEENSLLEDKFLISRQFALEANEELQEIKRELVEKNRQLAAAQNAISERSAEQAQTDLQIIQLKAEIAEKFLELESVRIQLSIQQATAADIVRTLNVEPSNAAETEGVIERLKQTINDLTVRSEFFYKEDAEEEVGEKQAVMAVTGHGHLISELRNSVDSLQATLEGFEWNLQHAAAQLKIGKDALNHAEFERDQLTSNVQKLGERLLAREVEVKSAQKHPKSSDGCAVISPVKSMPIGYSVYDTIESPSKDNEYTLVLEPDQEEEDEEEGVDWEVERAELLARCQAYSKEIEDTRQLAAVQQRQALLADYPTQPVQSETKNPLTPKSPVPSSPIRSTPFIARMPSKEKYREQDKDKEKEKEQEREKVMFKPPVELLSPQNILVGTSSMRMAAEKAIASDDVYVLKSELNVQLGRYDSVRATNAKLLQKLQAVRGNIQVCCRTRPPTDNELAAAQLSSATPGSGGNIAGKLCVDVSDENEISIYDKRAELWKSFAFDRVWPFDTTQAEVFSDVEPLVLSVTEGFNTCLFAYGQTGSGKTFTMNGYGREYGVSYRTLQRIFETLELKKSQAIAAADRVERAGVRMSRRTSIGSLDCSMMSEKMDRERDRDRGDKGERNAGVDTEGSTSHDTDTFRDNDDEAEASVYSYSVNVSMMEIYNEQVYDLLSLSSSSLVSGAGREGLDIRQAPDGTVSVPGLHKVSVCTLGDVMEVFSRGSGNRATTSTNLNEHSSRSHLIMLIDVDTVHGDSPPVRSKLFLVDLAGSERVGKSGVTGIAMKEAQYINKSLSALGDVMEALDQKSKFIPYRNSKLTYLLQDALGGNSRTMMVVTVCPTDATSDETLFTLQFASRVRNISMGAAKKNAANGKNMEEAVRVLKSELKESKKKRQMLEDSIGDIKKDQKKSNEKSSTIMDVKVRAAEEKKAKIEILYEQLQKSHQDLANKLQEERELKNKAQDQLKDAMRETEREKAERVRERIEREKARVVEREDAVRQTKIAAERERAEKMRIERSAISRLSRKTVEPELDLDNETTASTPPNLDSPRSCSSNTDPSDKEKEKDKSAAATDRSTAPTPAQRTLPRTPSFTKPPLTKGSSSGSFSSLGPSTSVVSSYKPSNGVLNRSIPKPPDRSLKVSVPLLNTSSLGDSIPKIRPRGLPHSGSGTNLSASGSFTSRTTGSNSGSVSSSIPVKSSSYGRRPSVKVDEDWSLEGAYRGLGRSVSHDDMDSLDVPRLGPSLVPCVRSNIAARSKEALQRHQVRMEARRAEKLIKQMAQM